MCRLLLLLWNRLRGPIPGSSSIVSSLLQISIQRYRALQKIHASSFSASSSEDDDVQPWLTDDFFLGFLILGPFSSIFANDDCGFFFRFRVTFFNFICLFCISTWFSFTPRLFCLRNIQETCFGSPFFQLLSSFSFFFFTLFFFQLKFIRASCYNCCFPSSPIVFILRSWSNHSWWR